MRRLRHFAYLISRWLIKAIVRPKLAGNAPVFGTLPEDQRPQTIFVLENRSLSDLIVLDILNHKLGLPDPLDSITLGAHQERRRMFFLNRASYGWFQRNTMSRPSERMVRILRYTPTSASRDRSIAELLLSSASINSVI